MGTTGDLFNISNYISNYLNDRHQMFSIFIFNVIFHSPVGDYSQTRILYQRSGRLKVLRSILTVSNSVFFSIKVSDVVVSFLESDEATFLAQASQFQVLQLSVGLLWLLFSPSLLQFLFQTLVFLLCISHIHCIIFQVLFLDQIFIGNFGSCNQ